MATLTAPEGNGVTGRLFVRRRMPHWRHSPQWLRISPTTGRRFRWHTLRYTCSHIIQVPGKCSTIPDKCRGWHGRVQGWPGQIMNQTYSMQEEVIWNDAGRLLPWEYSQGQWHKGQVRNHIAGGKGHRYTHPPRWLLYKMGHNLREQFEQQDNNHDVHCQAWTVHPPLSTSTSDGQWHCQNPYLV